jgi:diacylglycerol kinase (ATP)
MRDWLMDELQRLGDTVLWSYEGWVAAWEREKSLRQWTGINVASVALSLVADMTTGERALIYALGLLILAAELANTAIEETIDYISTDMDPRAKRAKDAGSACVAVTALAGGVAWLVILIG